MTGERAGTASSQMSPRPHWLWPTAFGLTLFVLNNLAVISGWLFAPPGYEPLFLHRAHDLALYQAWAHGYLHRVLVPSYAAPWAVEPAFFNLFMFVVARLSLLTGLSIAIVQNILHAGAFVMAGHALFFAVRTFMTRRRQALATALVVLCGIPLASVAVLPAWLLGREGPPIGIGHFVWLSSDGFVHGLATSSPLVTFGTGATLLSFTFLARYLRDGQRPDFIRALAATFALTIVHATEGFLVAGAGGLALLVLRGWKGAFRDAAMLGAVLGLGLLPYVLMTARVEWLQELANQSRWQLPPSVLDVVAALGLPTLLVAALLLTRPAIQGVTDRLLLCWCAMVLVLWYTPLIPSPQHVVDGYHYAIAMLLVRLAWSNGLVTSVVARVPRLAMAGAATMVVLSTTAFAAYYAQTFEDGPRPTPERLFSTVALVDEREVTEWLRANVSDDVLVLAPPEHAPWIASAPVHSFASHWHWGLTTDDQSTRSLAFYDGTMSDADAAAMLDEFGVRFVLATPSGPEHRYLARATLRATVGRFEVYEFPGAQMKPFPDLHARRAGAPAH